MSIKLLVFRFLIFFMVVHLTACGSAQKIPANSKKVQEVDQLISQRRWSEADKALEVLLEKDKANGNLLHKAGMVKYRLGQKENALALFVKADSLSNGANPDWTFDAAMCAYEINRFSDAEVLFGKFVNTSSEGKRKERAKVYLSKILRIKTDIQNSPDLDIKPLIQEINTENEEFLAFPTLDDQKLLFSRRIKTRNASNEQLMVAEKEAGEWAKLKEFGLEGIATGTLSGDGKTLVSTTCDPGRSMGSCDLMIAYLKDGDWGNPKNMTDRINSREWDAQPSISADGNTIIFSSSRRGGIGGRDLYITKKGPDGWLQPLNLGLEINTSANEESPYIHPDNQTLYFRSDHERGLGSYDIYLSRYDAFSKTWSQPVNLGYPINTPEDDGALTLASDGITAYMTSNRKYQAHEIPNYNIYTFRMPSHLNAIPTTFVKIATYDQENRLKLQSQVKILAINDSIPLYNGVLDLEGELTFPLSLGKTYNILVNYDGYFPVSTPFYPSENTTITQPLLLEVPMVKINKAQPMIFNNILFETGSAQLKNEVNPDLDYLLQFLVKNPTIKIKITGHTDSSGQSNANQKLSELRAQSVAGYLIKNGIAKDRLITEGKGDTSPVADNKDEEGRRLNRRTEVWIL